MDRSRLPDLELLTSVMNDDTVPAQRRKRAFEQYKKIMQQMGDKKLREMRERLRKANDIGDHKEQAKIIAQIKEYTGEEHEYIQN